MELSSLRRNFLSKGSRFFRYPARAFKLLFFPYFAAADKSARIWDTYRAKQLRIFEGHLQGVSDVGWSPDGRYIASACDDGMARLWDVAAVSRCCKQNKTKITPSPPYPTLPPFTTQVSPSSHSFNLASLLSPPPPPSIFILSFCRGNKHVNHFAGIQITLWLFISILVQMFLLQAPLTKV